MLKADLASWTGLFPVPYTLDFRKCTKQDRTAQHISCVSFPFKTKTLEDPVTSAAKAVLLFLWAFLYTVILSAWYSGISLVLHNVVVQQNQTVLIDWPNVTCKTQHFCVLIGLRFALFSFFMQALSYLCDHKSQLSKSLRWCAWWKSTLCNQRAEGLIRFLGQWMLCHIIQVRAAVESFRHRGDCVLFLLVIFTVVHWRDPKSATLIVIIHKLLRAPLQPYSWINPN